MSSLPDPAQAFASLIGFTEERTAVVEARRFQQWADAVGDRNPLYFDLDAAKAQGHPRLLAPPMYLSTVTSTPPQIGDLRPDGTQRDRVAYGPLPDDASLPERRVAGGEERWFFAPVYAGDVITSRRTLESIEPKTGRSGDFYVVTWVALDHNQDGVLVGKCVSKMIAR